MQIDEFLEPPLNVFFLKKKRFHKANILQLFIA